MADINYVVEKCLVMIQKHKKGKRVWFWCFVCVSVCLSVYLFRSLLKTHLFSTLFFHRLPLL